MNSVPPNPAVLPVLTERLEPEDAVIKEDIVAPPFAVQPSAYAQAVYRGPELARSADVPLLEAPAIDLDELWLRIAPGMQQQLLERVDAELDALAPPTGRQAVRHPQANPARLACRGVEAGMKPSGLS